MGRHQRRLLPGPAGLAAVALPGALSARGGGRTPITLGAFTAALAHRHVVTAVIHDGPSTVTGTLSDGRVRDLCERATSTAPAIVFVDEIGAVGRHRGAGAGPSCSRNGTSS